LGASSSAFTRPSLQNYELDPALLHGGNQLKKKGAALDCTDRSGHTVYCTAPQREA
jgi:hypothetical protein